MACCGVSNSVDQDDEKYVAFDQPSKFGPRSLTDRPALIFMVLFFGVLFALIGVGMVNGDIDQLISGYDDCGNVCGKDNEQAEISPYSCFGKDMTDKKYLLIDLKYTKHINYTEKSCIHDCEAKGGQIIFLNRCLLKSSYPELAEERNFLQNVSEDFQRSWRYIILMSLLAFVFSVIMMFLLRYATAFVVWFVLIAICVLFTLVTAYLCYLLHNAEPSEKTGLMWSTIIMATVTCLMIMLIIFFIKRIKLIIQIFKEAVKAVAAMPMLLFQPIWTFISLFIIFVCGFYSSMWIFTYSNLHSTKRYPDAYDIYYEKDKPSDYLEYEPTTTSVVILLINWFGILWIIQFVLGCQHLIVGGSVASWYFTRNRDNLSSPIKTNTSNLVKYHLGTIAFGSLIITIVEVVKQFVRYLRACMRSRKNIIMMLLLCALGSFLEWLEEFLKFFSRNAYVMTAIYGVPFCKGGEKAFKLLLNNIFSVIAINSIGDYVLLFMKMFIVLFTSVIGYEVLQGLELHYIWMQIIIIILIASFISHCFITIVEMTLETIFLCFCEDCDQNDGLSKPYYMSRNLMEFVENSSKVMKVPWEAEQLQSWENGPKKILQQPC